MTLGRRGRDARRLALAAAMGVVLVGCAETRSEIQTTFREGRIAQESYYAGKAKYDHADYAGAIPHFERTLSLDPKYDEAEVYLGWSYYHQGKFPDATRYFRQVVARQPRWEGAWNGLGWSQYRAREYPVALEAFQEAVALDPTYRDAAIGLAYSLFELGRYREALPHLHRLTREAEGQVFGVTAAGVEEVRSRYSWCLYYVGRYHEARAEFAKGLRARPTWAGLHSGLGWTYLKLGDRVKARASFRQALRLAPDDADARAGLAEASR